MPIPKKVEESLQKMLSEIKKGQAQLFDVCEMDYIN